MKRPVTSFALLLLLLYVVLVSEGYSAVIRVTPGQNVAAVIDKARHGDTLAIEKGVYRQGNIVIRKKIAIIGRGFPVFDGLGKYEVFLIAADSVLIEGLCIQNTGRSSMSDIAAIKVADHDYVTVRGNRIINSTYGIYLQNSRHARVLDNMIRSNAKDELSGGNGIHAWKSSALLIQGNKVAGHRDGIYFEFVSRSVIRRNISFGNLRYGLHFMFSNNDIYRENTFRDNGAGVAVMYSREVDMIGNTFYHNWGDASYGILLKEISDGRIHRNRFIRNTVGIYMEGTNRITVDRNAFEDNGWALRVQANCSSGTFTGNNFTGNSFDVATNGTMVLNTFSGNFWDKYDGYDLDKDGGGDVPYYPVSAYSVISEQVPIAMILYRSFLSGLIELAEKILPSITPGQLKDDSPRMKKLDL